MVNPSLSPPLLRLVDSRLVLWRQDIGAPDTELSRATAEQSLEMIRQDGQQWMGDDIVSILLIGDGAVVVLSSGRVLWRAPRDFHEYTVSQAVIVMVIVA